MMGMARGNSKTDGYHGVQFQSPHASCHSLAAQLTGSASLVASECNWQTRLPGGYAPWAAEGFRAGREPDRSVRCPRGSMLAGI